MENPIIDEPSLRSKLRTSGNADDGCVLEAEGGYDACTPMIGLTLLEQAVPTLPAP